MTNNELCAKITELYPDIGTCGLTLDVDYRNDKKAWEVKLVKGGHRLLHYLEDPDAQSCMEGRQCVSLGLEIAQLKKNIEGEQF